MNDQNRNSLIPMVLISLLIMAADPPPSWAQSDSALAVLKSRPVWRDLPPIFLNFLAERLKTAETVTEFAEVYEKSGFLDRQKEGFSQASPGDGLDLVAGIIAASLTNHGNEMGDQQDFEKAKRAAELAILIRPRHLAAWYCLATSYYFLNDCQNAVVWSKKALEFKPDPNSPDAWERQLALDKDPDVAEQRKQAESSMKKILEDCSGKK